MPTVDPRLKSPLASAAVFAGLSVLLSILASGITGRALWCDEILRIHGQNLTISQLLHFVHLKTFCTQTTAAYLFMRPWQHLFGMETGGFILSALSGGIVTLATLLATSRLLGGKRPHTLASLLVATNPLLVYYGSELAFYSMWSAAGALVFALLVKLVMTAGPDGHPWSKASLMLILASTALVAFHFAGLFIWSIIATMTLLVLWQTYGFRKAFNYALVFSIPVLINLPMYIGSMRAPEHIGSKGLEMEKLGTLLPSLGHYVYQLFPSLTGGWWLGALLYLVGAMVLLKSDAPKRRVLWIALAATVSVIPFLSYSLLRDYMPTVARYWVCSIAPALTLVALGLHTLLTRQNWLAGKLLGWIGGGVILACNLLACSALVAADGRMIPYKYFQDYVKKLPPSRNVVFTNQYESRFLGEYYKLPANGRVGFPCFWEEGAEARARGLQAIWQLIPDAVCYARFHEVEHELKQAGIVKSGNGLKWSPPPLMMLVYRLHLHPEPPTDAEEPFFLLHNTLDMIAQSAEATATPAIVPSPGWLLVDSRNPTGKLQFGIIAQGPAFPSFQIYIPQSAKTSSPWNFDLGLLSFLNITLSATIDGGKLEGSVLIPKTVAKSMYLPTRQTFQEMPLPADWLKAGHDFVVQATPASLTLPLGPLSPGWHAVSLDSGRKDAPLVVIDHQVYSRSPPKK